MQVPGKVVLTWRILNALKPKKGGGRKDGSAA
jgi:hypothetical protein